LAAELGFWPATTDEADIEHHRQHNKNADYWLARVIDSITCAGSTSVGTRSWVWSLTVRQMPWHGRHGHGLRRRTPNHDAYLSALAAHNINPAVLLARGPVLISRIDPLGGHLAVYPMTSLTC
jgi:hypothetical protein